MNINKAMSIHMDEDDRINILKIEFTRRIKESKKLVTLTFKFRAHLYIFSKLLQLHLFALKFHLEYEKLQYIEITVGVLEASSTMQVTISQALKTSSGILITKFLLTRSSYNQRSIRIDGDLMASV